jgi:hypothetical protein
MNIFRLIGDMCHLFSFLVLLLKINVSKSVKGVSLKTERGVPPICFAAVPPPCQC